jgi:hypothetical protein
MHWLNELPGTRLNSQALSQLFQAPHLKIQDALTWWHSAEFTVSRTIILDKTQHSTTSLAKHLGGYWRALLPGVPLQLDSERRNRGSSMSRPTQPEDPGHGLTNYCNFCCVIVKTSIDYWPINDESIHFHPWNQTFTQMKPTTLTDQIKHFHTLNQSLASIKSITFIEINNVLGGTRLNSQRLGQLLETIQSTR